MIAHMPDLPPGPRSSTWGLLSYLRDPIGCMAPLAARWGDPFTLPGDPPTVITGDPACIKAIYTADPDGMAPLSQDMRVFLGDHSLILQSGPQHRRARRLLGPPLMGSRMRAYSELIRQITLRRAEGWAPGAVPRAMELGQAVSLDVILGAVFGVTEVEQVARFGRLLMSLMDAFSPILALFPVLRREFGGVGPFATFRRRRAAVDAALDELITAGRAAGPREDVLSLMLAARDEAGEPLSDAEIRDQLLLLVVAGHETTAIAISWALYALHRPENAAIRERLLAELAGLPADAPAEELAKLPWLEAVCLETLRRYPLAPAPSPRRLREPLELPGYSLPAGTAVCVSISLAHFREELYPDPWTFRPERFLERSYSPFEFVPFGGGARRCLGYALATQEMKIVVGTLMRRFRLKLASERPERAKVRGVNVGPASGVRLQVEDRLTVP